MENKIKELLTQRGITQKELASMTGMTPAGLNRAISGSASKQTLNKIASALGVQVSELTSQFAKVRYRGVLDLNGISIPCYVLDNRERVLSGRMMQEALKMVDDNKNTSGHRLARYLNQKTLMPYLSKYLEMGHLEPIVCYDGNTKINGYKAEALADICDVFLEARKRCPLSTRQMIIAEQCEILMRSFARVGITALVDEATGYAQDKERAKDALQQFLNTFLREEASRWVKTFNDQFFEDLYRMKGWDWGLTAKKPGIVGQYINEIVYLRIGPSVYDELRKRNPKNENGNRHYKHHQLLTDDVGKPRLLQHLEAVHALCVTANYNWKVFKQYLDRVYPRSDESMTIFFDDIED